MEHLEEVPLDGSDEGWVVEGSDQIDDQLGVVTLATSSSSGSPTSRTHTMDSTIEPDLSLPHAFAGLQTAEHAAATLATPLVEPGPVLLHGTPGTTSGSIIAANEESSTATLATGELSFPALPNASQQIPLAVDSPKTTARNNTAGITQDDRKGSMSQIVEQAGAIAARSAQAPSKTADTAAVAPATVPPIVPRLDLQQPAMQQQVAATATASSSSWGWSSAWGLQALGGKLQEVAAGLSELQQALANPESTDEEEEDAVGDDEGEHKERDAGAQAEVEAAPFAALGGLLSGVAKGGWSVGQVIASKVGAATKEMSAGVSEDMHQLQQAASSLFGAAGQVSMIGSRLEKGLESMGRTAFGLMDAAGQYAAGIPSQEQEPESTSFDHFFSLYGGQRLCVELQELSEECASSCNQAMEHMGPTEQQELQALLARLEPLFAVSELSAAATAATAATGMQDAGVGGGGAAGGGECWAQLQLRYEPVAELVVACRTRASEAALQLRTADAVRLPATAVVQSAGTAAGSTPAALLVRLGGEAAERLAGVTAAQIQILLECGDSLSAPMRGSGIWQPLGGGSSSGGLPWPAEPLQQAALVQRLAGRMVSDAQLAAAVFAEAVAGGSKAVADHAVLPVSSSPAKAQEVQGQAGTSATAVAGFEQRLEEAKVAALLQLQQGYQGLLQCVLVRSLGEAAA